MHLERIEVCGVPVDCLTMSDAVRVAESWIRTGDRPLAILAVNPEKVVRAQRDPQLLTALHAAGLLIPDGIGVVLAAKLFGFSRTERVPGSELMPLLCQRAALKGYRVFLFGASPDVISCTAQVLQQRFAGLKIVGAQHGYVKEDDTSAMITRINAVQADLLFVALGSPKQEMWIARYLPELKVKVCQGVGGTFDVIAGRVKRAPLLFRAIHLEWFYRLLSQPSRVFRQTALPMFACQVLKSKFTRRLVQQSTFSVPTTSVSRELSDSGKSDHHREKAA